MSTNSTDETTLANTDDSAVAEGGAYEVIRKRLIEQGKSLANATDKLNQQRLSEFGDSSLEVVGRIRVRTENNCIARDIVQVGDCLLFGYNVFIGLKKETKINDVFALFKLQQNQDTFELGEVSIESSFLTQTSFANDFDELYRYYKQTKLIQLAVKDGKLLAAFQIGERLSDIRVFRWTVSADGKQVDYIDNRGERDIQLPPKFDFEWTNTAREDAVQGRYPHINILDTLFVETTGGDLTIKVENNTEVGRGIYDEPVEVSNQSLDDAQIAFAKIGDLILLKVLPYKETTERFFIYNTLTEAILRVDEIGQSCVQLPEDHGLIFPGGYYLQTGEIKRFDEETQGLRFKRMMRSPNGEDVLYVFYEPEEGVVGLFAYNLIQKQLQNPIYGHGYALAEDGRLIIFSAENEPTRVHPMQIWKTPYQSQEFAASVPASQTFFGRIGNAEMVRGISDLYSICRIINNQSVSLKLYEELAKTAAKIFDSYYWLEDQQTEAIASSIKEINSTAELVIDEFEKVQSIRKQSEKTLAEAIDEQSQLIETVRNSSWQIAEEFVKALKAIRHQRGHLTTIKDYRYINIDKIKELDQQLVELDSDQSSKTVQFLADEQALDPYYVKIDELNRQVEQSNTNAELTPLIDTIEGVAEGLDLLSELMSTLKVDDVTLRTQIIDAISGVYGQINQSVAQARNKRKNLGAEEATAQFGAQFKLFSQSITNALSMATTPEKCEEQLSRLLVQLEELESQFTDFDQFLADIIEKREEVYETFESHKQSLLDAQQRKAQSIADAAERIIISIDKRSQKFTSTDQLNTFFASDTLILKTRELVESLKALDSSVKADDIEARLKGIKDQALRAIRDKTDIYESGGNIIKLGPRHKFSVNTQELDLTILPRNDYLTYHLTGTDYFEVIDDESLQTMQDYWQMALVSETDQVYRAEYLAYQVLNAAEKNDQIKKQALTNALLDSKELTKLVQDYAQPKYKEGYEKGVHDHDAAAIIYAIAPLIDSADLLIFDPKARAIAQIFWANLKNLAKRSSNDYKKEKISYSTWPERAESAAHMQSVFASVEALDLLSGEINSELTAFIDRHPLPVSALDIKRAADYLVKELAREQIEFITSKYAVELVEEFKRSMDEASWRRYHQALDKLLGWPAERWSITVAWLKALTNSKPSLQKLSRYIPEATAIINADERLERRHSQVDLEFSVEKLLGDHPNLKLNTLTTSLDEFLLRLEQHQHEVVPEYHRFQKLRLDAITNRKKTLRLNEFKPRPLSSFVRNRLINESYLPIIGDNLAKQMGTVGENKRTDLMGLLMMISPPGYGKTTLMEYVANRLGLIFMKINCPSLGHDVLSLDPAQSPNATARQELEKLNLALEMGNNVMLYLDDIQHTHPEFLQKFISLCDGTRRIEGVWKGNTKTYDMRGKKFCVVMAGNPYTESGEAFKIPDMLANRADIYNLGDILGGMDEQFALSYIENSLTSNPVLAPLALREMDDVYKLVRMAKGDSIATTDLSHQYSGAEINEITEVLKKMFVVQDVVLKINQQYIASAAQDDKYRTEPAFKLQGSYRNMNKMAEKISAVMNNKELIQMIDDHYLGESQLLTTGAEANLLKLAELRNTLTDQQAQRWQQIKSDFLRNKSLGGDDADVGSKLIAQMVDLVSGVQGLTVVAEGLANKPTVDRSNNNTGDLTAVINQLAKVVEKTKPQIKVVNEPVPGIDKVLTVLANTIEHSILPLVKTMDKKLEIDLRTHEKMKEISGQLRQLGSQQSDA